MSKNPQNQKPGDEQTKTQAPAEEKTPEQIIADLKEENENLKAELEKANANLKIYAEDAVKRNEESKKAKAATQEVYELSDAEFKKIAEEKLKAHREKIPADKQGKFVHIQYLNHSSLRKNKTAPNPGDIVLCRTQVAEILKEQGKAEIITQQSKKEK